MRRWVSYKEDPSTEDTGSVSSQDNGSGALDPTVLASLEDLEEDGEQSLVAELAGMFLEDADSRRETIRKAVSDGDANAVRQAAHALKGSSGNIGVRRVHEVCARLEEAAESEELDQAQELLERLDEEFERARPELVALRERTA
ncbi:hypothetical protein BH24ACT22_BH24ACT22_20720 [soil metagenome]